MCWRCGLLIARGAPWHLGHDDLDPSYYRGPEHEACNVGASNRQGPGDPPPRVRAWWHEGGTHHEDVHEVGTHEVG